MTFPGEIKRKLTEKRLAEIDRHHDRIITGQGERKESGLIDLQGINEYKTDNLINLKYPQAIKYTEKKVEDSNRNSETQIRINRVENTDNDSRLFETVNGPQPKFTYQIGNNTRPEFNILFITATHGEESRLWIAGLEALMQLAGEGEQKKHLLSRGQITFDIFSDIQGFDNQSRGYVSRDGIQVNEPLVTGRKHDRNPFGLGDRNGAQGRNSQEAVSVLSRSNQAHYKKTCGPLTWVGDHHETNENSHYPSSFFRYGGIMLMAHIYLTDSELGTLNSLRRALTFSDKVRMAVNNWLPFSDPIYREQILYNHPSLKTMRRIRDRARSLGQRTFEDINEKAILLYPHVERDFSIDESIWVGGEMFRLPGILLGPDVLAPEGMTSESFQQDLTVRIRQTLAVMEAQLTVIGIEGGNNEY